MINLVQLRNAVGLFFFLSFLSRMHTSESILLIHTLVLVKAKLQKCCTSLKRALLNTRCKNSRHKGNSKTLQQIRGQPCCCLALRLSCGAGTCSPPCLCLLASHQHRADLCHRQAWCKSLELFLNTLLFQQFQKLQVHKNGLKRIFSGSFNC